ncbi:uncharacterized protein V6R79_021055 [Siganus canaliculatus]
MRNAVVKRTAPHSYCSSRRWRQGASRQDSSCRLRNGQTASKEEEDGDGKEKRGRQKRRHQNNPLTLTLNTLASDITDVAHSILLQVLDFGQLFAFDGLSKPLSCDLDGKHHEIMGK